MSGIFFFWVQTPYKKKKDNKKSGPVLGDCYSLKCVKSSHKNEIIPRDLTL